VGCVQQEAAVNQISLKKESQKNSNKCLTIRRSSIEQLEARLLFSTMTPAQIEQAYGFNKISFTVNGKTTSGTGAGETIAIVDAYSDPNIVSDLETFDKTYGISNNDSTGKLALSVLTPEGQPAADAGWSTEISLDVEWAHAIAPAAHIDLVEAANSSLSDLLGGVNYARNLAGVSVVSMSWGSSEFFSEQYLDGYFLTPAGHSGVTFVASSGDDGTTNWPATSPYVLAVGGTTLNTATNGTYQSESAWVDSGGGYSPIENTWAPDVSYDANPSTGFSVYDSVAYNGVKGWQTIGGTSAGAPQWAALVAIADQGRALHGLSSLSGTQTLDAIYAAPAADFHDITTGHNLYYYATPGWDPATGLGTPVANLLTNYLSTYGTTSTVAVAAAQTTTSSGFPFFFSNGGGYSGGGFLTSSGNSVTGSLRDRYHNVFSRISI
jgi:subtilase family serine protease